MGFVNNANRSKVGQDAAKAHAEGRSIFVAQIKLLGANNQTRTAREIIEAIESVEAVGCGVGCSPSVGVRNKRYSKWNRIFNVLRNISPSFLVEAYNDRMICVMRLRDYKAQNRDG
jgi:hypothetical protein